MSRLNLKIFKQKYALLKSNVHFLKVKNKKTFDKINFQKNDLKYIAKKYIYAGNESRNWDRYMRSYMDMDANTLITAAVASLALTEVAIRRRRTQESEEESQESQENQDSKEEIYNPQEESQEMSN